MKPTPATPMMVARFVADIAPWGIDKIWPIVQQISRAHYTVGLADPTLGGPVAATINEIAKIEPPRSWPKEQKARFAQLPYDLQVYAANHDRQREREIHRAHSEAAKLRQELAKVKNGKPENVAA
ncbi:hypothetical protein AB8Z38_06735 [Bradyrhizobium sp. LLZ17]|uniref:Uncharacterized protein n=1 Tax=Bradyrhizobium sp. LLZ17 TaxID=3239388 RepID=A0AB39XML8_9BRAD